MEVMRWGKKGRAMERWEGGKGVKGKRWYGKGREGSTWIFVHGPQVATPLVNGINKGEYGLVPDYRVGELTTFSGNFLVQKYIYDNFHKYVVIFSENETNYGKMPYLVM